MEVDETGSDETGRHPMWGPVQLHPLSYPNVNIDCVIMTMSYTVLEGKSQCMRYK